MKRRNFIKVGVAGIATPIFLSENKNKSTVVLLGPGPENTLGMIPGNLILSDGINSINITNPGYEAMVTN